MPETVIKVEKLGKLYRLGELHRQTNSFRDKVTSFFKRDPTSKETEQIWALKNVSFEVEEGEILGIIGRNGAGKSTLLKILSRITKPTMGKARIDGRVRSLLEVGTGFHPELTGRENIFLNGAILGMRKQEIKRKFHEIVAFAEIEKFIDTPVKHYSSGMYVRLAFAVAAQLESEILLVDEVLAVGDLAFQKKCLGKMGDIAKEGRTVLFVSHNMQAVRALCGRSLLLNEGSIIADAPTADTLVEYFDHLRQMEVSADTAVMNPENRRGSGAVRFTGIRIEDELGRECSKFMAGSTIRFFLSYRTFAPVDVLFVSILFRSGTSREPVTSLRHTVSLEMLYAEHTGKILIELPHVNLRPGIYPLYFWLGGGIGRPFDIVDDLTSPLIIYTDRNYEELGFDPTRPSGFFNIESRML